MIVSTAVQPRIVVRPQPLVPVAVVGVGSVAQMLAKRILQASDSELQGWTGVAGPNLLAVAGPADTLPWVDGVIFLGRDTRAPRLLVQTTHTLANMDTKLLEDAIYRSNIGMTAPTAVLFAPQVIFSLAHALPIVRERITTWLERRP